jgi:hypothetical protein
MKRKKQDCKMGTFLAPVRPWYAVNEGNRAYLRVHVHRWVAHSRTILATSLSN